MPQPDHLYHACLCLIFLVSALGFPFLLFFPAPYGRHVTSASGPRMNATWGWLLMELPPPIIFAAVFLWEAHYFYRSVLYPFLLRVRAKQKPLAAVAVGFTFNMINGFLNAYAITNLAPHLTDRWLLDPRFGLGIVLMVIGFSINAHSDRILRHLREPGETGYKIPYGGLYRWISCPNYLGEIIEWSGFALATWTTAGLSFLVFTVANLLPRAVSHHRWYRERFEDYPRDRAAIVPRIL
jgi:protein-S-isoprenylcysteine O-methyltransferase Ste14